MTQYTNRLPDEEVNAPDRSFLKQVFSLIVTFIIIIFFIFMVSEFFGHVIAPLIPHSIHKKIGHYYLPTFTKEKLSEHPRQKYISEIFERILDQAGVEDKSEWEIHYTKSDIPAATLPGKTLFISDKLFRYVCYENALAFVIAHEVGHAKFYHPEKAVGKILPNILFKVFLSSQTPVIDQFQSLVQLKLSRENEMESDNFAKKIIKGLYGHLKGSDEFFLKMQTGNPDSKNFHWLSTHPNLKTRINNLTSNKSGSLLLIPPQIRDEHCVL